MNKTTARNSLLLAATVISLSSLAQAAEPTKLRAESAAYLHALGTPGAPLQVATPDCWLSCGG